MKATRQTFLLALSFLAFSSNLLVAQSDELYWQPRQPERSREFDAELELRIPLSADSEPLAPTGLRNVFEELSLDRDPPGIGRRSSAGQDRDEEARPRMSWPPPHSHAPASRSFASST